MEKTMEGKKEKHIEILNAISQLVEEKDKFQDLVDRIQGTQKPKDPSETGIGSPIGSSPLIEVLNGTPDVLRELRKQFEEIRILLIDLLF